MKITQKFLLFGLTPAICQAGICIQLFSLLSSVEYYAEEEVKQSLLARTLVTGVARSLDVAIATASYAATPFEELRTRVEETTKAADKIYAELIAQTRDDPTTRAEIQELINTSAQSQKEFLQERLVHPNDDLAQDSPAKNIEFGKVRRSLKITHQLKTLARTLDRENVRLEEIRTRLRANRAAVKNLVLAELILSTVAIAVLYLLFRLDFSRRFNDLLENARELALDRPASKTVSGNDELSYLSQALVTAAEARRDAVAQKQLLFQMVTHDLRSPLMAASLVVETLLTDQNSTTEKKESRLKSIERSLQRVVSLSNDLLTIEQLSAGAMELNRSRVDFQETIEHAIETVKPLADRKNCALVNHAPMLLASIDEDRILQVTTNLLANAIKFSPSGSTVDITAAKENNRLRVEVMDRGPGISEADIQKLFNPFKQARDGKNSAGFGLGLAIAKMLVELHEGTIGAHQREGGGTVFWFTIKL
ncbi:MAG: HAMP domain-containing histidine kinase [Cyanobacteria bacterium SZAS LIN-2]|nr:HAMP domain-containing histidine kinase [Cyanobacteria bacterium SZAS LIN-2]